MMGNRDIARVFSEIAEILAIQGENRRRIAAYERAAEAIASLGQDQDVAAAWRDGRLTEIPGIGKVLAEKIDEMLATGKLGFYERLKAEVPSGVVQMLQIPDVGPRKAARFWNELGVTTVDALEAAARAGRVQQMSRMGARTEANLLIGIQALRQWHGQTPLGVAWYLANGLLASLREMEVVGHAAVAGSVRRMKDSVGDIDLLVTSSDPPTVTARFLEVAEGAEIVLSGTTKTTIRTREGLQVDLRVLEPQRWGTALQYFTGSQAHNVRLRQLAREQGCRLNEYEFTLADASELVCEHEAEVYQQLGMQWIPPELREDQGEVEAALAGALPQLVERSDLCGDLQMHTTRSDGHQSLAEMAAAARAAGIDYILITDHSQSMAVAGGQSTDDLVRQRAEIAEENARHDDLSILAGTEVEIRADGTLDYPDEVLAELDLVVASLHTGLRAGRERTTERVLAAIRNPHVDIIAHPTGRLIGRREGADLDMEAILQAAAETGTAIEVNAHPDRLDLSASGVRRAVELGVKLAISSDAHDAHDFEHLFFGVATARRGWATPDDVINTWDLDRLMSWASAKGQ